jgi:valyl-tRNA synthetase
MMNDKAIYEEKALANLTNADKWILSKLNKIIDQVTDNMDKFELGVAVSNIYDFIWEEFCDWYIEMVKPRLYSEDDNTKDSAIWTLKKVLIDSLKLLHPYMPFITEEIFCNIQDKEESIMISSLPVREERFNFDYEENAVETIKMAVRGIRDVRTAMNVAPSHKAKVYVVTADEGLRHIFEEGRVFFTTLAKAEEVYVQADKTSIGDDAVSTVIPNGTIYIPLADLVDIEKEIERLEGEKVRLQGELDRVNKMLSNEKFVSKAPQSKIDEEKEKLAKYTQMMEQVVTRLAQFKK